MRGINSRAMAARRVQTGLQCGSTGIVCTVTDDTCTEAFVTSRGCLCGGAMIGGKIPSRNMPFDTMAERVIETARRGTDRGRGRRRTGRVGPGGMARRTGWSVAGIGIVMATGSQT
jgi:hypothetical protein